MAHRFKELKVWQRAMSVARDVYRLTRDYPAEERFGLTSQMRRAAVSMPSNIAEGAGRGTNGDFRHFLDIALGSAYELETQVILSQDLAMTPTPEKLQEVLNELVQLQQMISGLRESLH